MEQIDWLPMADLEADETGNGEYQSGYLNVRASEQKYMKNVEDVKLEMKIGKKKVFKKELSSREWKDLKNHGQIGYSYEYKNTGKLYDDYTDDKIIIKIKYYNKELKKKFSEAADAMKTALHVKLGTLCYTEKEGFSVSAFLKQKAVLTLSVSGGEAASSSGRSERKSRTAEKIEVPTDILHPELYKQLIAWRNSEAAKAGLPVYTIIQQKAILGIVNLLPNDAASLIRIPYFGKRGAEKYGDALLEMVNRYVEEHGIERPQMPTATLTVNNGIKTSKEPKPLKEAKSVKEPKPDTKEVTYRLFRQGKSIEEIAKERELVSGTIAGHLEHYVRSGEVKIEQLVAREKITKIIRYVQAHGSDKGLTVIKAALGDDVSYADIRLVLAAGIK